MCTLSFACLSEIRARAQNAEAQLLETAITGPRLCLLDCHSLRCSEYGFMGSWAQLLVEIKCAPVHTHSHTQHVFWTFFFSLLPKVNRTRKKNQIAQ